MAGTHGNALKIRLAAPPLEGRANEALVAFIAKHFGVPKRDVRVVSGERSREKRIEVRGSTFDPQGLIPEDRDR